MVQRPIFQKTKLPKAPQKAPNSSKINKIRTWMDSKSPLCSAIQTDTPASKRSASKPYSEQASKSASSQVSEPVSQRASKPASQQPATDITERAGGRGEALRYLFWVILNHLLSFYVILRHVLIYGGVLLKNKNCGNTHWPH